jgi:hypothetical protein
VQFWTSFNFSLRNFVEFGFSFVKQIKTSVVSSYFFNNFWWYSD